jgi:hypothetical protein
LLFSIFFQDKNIVLKNKNVFVLLSKNYFIEIMAAISKDTRDKISFISFIIPEFAQAYKMKIQDAYFYLKKIWRT